MAVIEFFEVPVRQDEAFLAAWREERPPGATLLRAIREDVPVRFVGLAPLGGADELLYEEGAPEGDGGVVLVHTFAARSLTEWHALRGLCTGRRGYLGTRLYRHGEARFVHLARWSSPLMVFRAVRDPGFAAAAAAIGLPERPALYQVV